MVSVRLLVPAKVMSPWPLNCRTGPEARLRGEKELQGLKPSSFATFAARLKSCPDTKPSWNLVRNRLTLTLVLQGPINSLRESLRRCDWVECSPVPSLLGLDPLR